MHKRGRYAALAAMVALGLIASPAFASRSVSRFVSFDTFRGQLGRAAYVRSVASPAAFASMKSYLQRLYGKVRVRDSFVSDGTYFDCVTTMTQPSVTALGITHIATPPPGAPSARPTQATSGRDASGKVVSCPSGTIPMQRTTLAQMSRYRSVRAFLTRGKSAPASDIPGYKHAHALEKVNNDGAVSTINVWNPTLPGTAANQDHSLSQQWIEGGTGSAFQTAEAGWTRDRGFNATKPVFFIFWTRDDYNATGCYNLECTGFVQTNSSVGLGAAIKPCCSVTGGADDRFVQEWYLYQGNWWIGYNNTWLGYYPTSIYAGGQMSQYAQWVDFGGEVYGGAGKWPKMGSGAYASAGYLKAAYQSGIEYHGTDGLLYYPTLTPSSTSKCYTIAYTGASGSTAPYFYYGGPGGKHSKCL